MKSKGKIMAAVLSAIVAASSFSAVTFADTSNIEYPTHPSWTNCPDCHKGHGTVDCVASASVGETVTVTATAEPGAKVERIRISAYYRDTATSSTGKTVVIMDERPNAETITRTFTMPNFTVHGSSTTISVAFSCPNSKPEPTPDPTPTPTPDPTPTPTPDPTPTPTPDPTPTPTPDPTPTWKKGDANCDGLVSAEDITAIIKHLTGKSKLSDQGFKNADMDDNGKVTAADVTTILKSLIR